MDMLTSAYGAGKKNPTSPSFVVVNVLDLLNRSSKCQLRRHFDLRLCKSASVRGLALAVRLVVSLREDRKRWRDVFDGHVEVLG